MKVPKGIIHIALCCFFITGETGEADHPKPEQIDHPFSWRKKQNFSGEEMSS
jgi:hypothetical protein